MGQRHQIFIRIANPVKFLNFKNKVEKVKYENELGTEDTTVLAFHNQWLYGRSALQNCLNLLKFGKQFSKDIKLGVEKYGGYDCPFSPNAWGSNFDLPEIIRSIEFVMNFRPVNTAWLGAGLGRTYYIGEMDCDSNIRKDFTRGDNNDGVTIIDLIENKYCFVNIYEQEKKSHSVCELPSMKPVSAAEYVKAYYGETISRTNPYYFKKTANKEDKQKVVDSAIKTNLQASKGFNEFEVLTLDELQSIFPEMILKLNLEVSK